MTAEHQLKIALTCIEFYAYQEYDGGFYAKTTLGLIDLNSYRKVVNNKLKERESKILDIITKSEFSLTATDIAKNTNIPITSVYRLLKKMEKASLLFREDNKYWKIKVVEKKEGETTQ